MYTASTFLTLKFLDRSSMVLSMILDLLDISCEEEKTMAHKAVLCILKAFENAVCLSYNDLLERYKRGHKGHLRRVLNMLKEKGFLKEKGDYFCLTVKGLAIAQPDPPQRPTLTLFLAGADTALRVAVEMRLQLNWLLSAGRYWGGGRFVIHEDFKLAKELGGLLFLDSGAQQFFAKFKGYTYPYGVRDYLDFAIKAGADLVATLDLPLDILVPRGLPVGEGVKKTVELGVEVVAAAEERGAEERVVPVLQGYDHPSQWLESLDLYKQHGIMPQRFRVWGIGSLCMSRSVRLTRAVLKEVRRALGDDVIIHVFGLSLDQLRAVYDLVDSYDTSAWVYWAKKDGAVLVWDPVEESFVHLQARDGRRYPTERLLRVNLLQLLAMHKHYMEKKYGIAKTQL